MRIKRELARMGEPIYHEAEEGDIMLKLFNGLNGIFYLLWGAWGTVYPVKSAELMGWEANTLLGLHEMRATWAAFAMIGVAILYKGLKDGAARGTAYAITMATAGLFLGRTLAVLMDGTGPQRTYAELGIEAVVVVLGLFLLNRSTAT